MGIGKGNDGGKDMCNDVKNGSLMRFIQLQVMTRMRLYIIQGYDKIAIDQLIFIQIR